MRLLTIILLLTILVIPHPVMAAPAEPSQHFTIRISRYTGVVTGQSTWTITQDAVASEVYPSLGDWAETYTAILAPADRQLIYNLLSRIDFGKIPSDTADNDAPDDLEEFGFKIQVNGQEKTFHIYQVKIQAVFDLVQQLNLLLPGPFRIGYDARYFRNKK